MKKLVLLFALTMMSAQSSFAHDDLSHLVGDDEQIISSTITEFDVKQDWLGYIDQGTIAINLTNKKMTLTLMSQPVCAPNMVCAAVMTEYHQIKVDLVNQYTDMCGATHYVGVKDKTPVDGLRETVHVVDYVTMTCEIFIPYATGISYETFNPWTQETIVSSFGAESLVIQPNFHH